MKVRCKFQCQSIETSFAGNTDWVKNEDGSFDYTKPTACAEVYRVRLVAVSSVGGEENKVFWEASPSGSFEISTMKKHEFVVGGHYYIDVISVDPPVDPTSPLGIAEAYDKAHPKGV